MMRRLILMGMLTLLTAVSSIAVTAQGLCAPIVANALALAEVNCGGMSNNMACYGNSTMTATYFDEIMNTTGTWTPGSQSSLSTIQLIEGSAVSSDGTEWGIAYFQIDMPEVILPINEAIRVIAMGDVLIENVPAEVASTSEFPATAGLSSPISTLLNSFHFSTGGDAPCLEAMNAIVIQPPQNTEIQLIVNSVPMRLGGTTVFGQTTGTEDNPMFVTAIDGDVILYPNTEREMRVSSGEVSIAVLSSDLDVESQPIVQAQTGLPLTDREGQPMLRYVPLTVFTTPLPLRDDTSGDIWSLDYYETLSQLPQAFLNYPISVTVPPPSVTRVDCILDAGSYTETWEVRNMPPTVNQIVFFGGFENAVPPQPTLTVVQNRPTQSVFGLTNEGIEANIQLLFEAACPLPPTQTPLPTFTPLPTATPTETLTPFPTTDPIALPTGVTDGGQSGIISTPTPDPNVDAFSLTATALVADLTATAQPQLNAFEQTATAIVFQLTATDSAFPSQSGAATTHVVSTGDTAFRIAQEYGVTLEQLLSANGLNDPNLIYIGQELVIP